MVQDVSALAAIGSSSTTASQAMASARPIGPDVLAGLGLDVHGRVGEAEQPRQVRPDRRLVRAELRLLGVDDHVAVDRLASPRRDPVDDLGQQPRAVRVAPCGVGVGIVLADVAQRRRAEQGVGHGVADDVGVGVPDQPTGCSIRTPPRIRGRPSTSRCVS